MINNWPLQIKLISEDHEAFDNQTLVISADCCSGALKDWYDKYADNNTVIIGCPKLDDIDYSSKLSSIFLKNNIKKIIVLRMEVPCCYGILSMTRRALEQTNKNIEIKDVIISVGGEVIA